LAFLFGVTAAVSRPLFANWSKLTFLFVRERFSGRVGEAVMLFGLLPSDVGGEDSGDEFADDTGLVGVELDSGVLGRWVALARRRVLMWN
jgi:hypothetical protein